MNPYLLINLKSDYQSTVPPIDFLSTLNLMWILPYKLNVICALEAAKIALPTLQTTNATKEEKKLPKTVVNLIESWLAGNVKLNTLENARKLIKSVNFDRASPIYFVYATVNATISATISASPFDVATAVANASDCFTNENQFYVEWWNKCYPIINDYYHTLCKQISGEI